MPDPLRDAIAEALACTAGWDFSEDVIVGRVKAAVRPFIAEAVLEAIGEPDARP